MAITEKMPFPAYVNLYRQYIYEGGIRNEDGYWKFTDEDIFDDRRVKITHMADQRRENMSYGNWERFYDIIGCFNRPSQVDLLSSYYELRWMWLDSDGVI